jgi:hypothetical protein
MNAISTPKVETEELDVFHSGAKPMSRVAGPMAVMEAQVGTYG